MSDGQSWFREYFPLFHKKYLVIWFLLIASISCILSLPINYSSNEMLQTLFIVSRNASWMIATGFSFSIGSSLLLCSRAIQTNVAKKVNSGGSIRFPILFVSYIIIMMLGTLAVCLIYFTSTFVSIGLNFAIFQFLPSFILISLLVTLLTSPIYAFIAFSVDSVRISLVVGIMVSFVILLITGNPGNPLRYPEIVFLAPVHLFSALLFVSTGTYDSNSMNTYVGVTFGLVHLIVPIIVLSIFTIVCYYGSSKMFIENKKRWSALRTNDDDWIQDGSAPEQPAAPLQTVELSQSLKNLDDRRRKVISVIVMVIILISAASYGYVQVHPDVSQSVVYESPFGGETVNIGEWMHGSFIGEERSQTAPLYPHCIGQILGLPIGMHNISLNYGAQQMSILDFQALNETEIEDAFNTGRGTYINTDASFMSCGSDVYQESEYVWILRITAVNGQTSGSINIWLQIILTLGPI